MAEKTITDFMQYKIDKGGEKWFATLAALSMQQTLLQTERYRKHQSGEVWEMFEGTGKDLWDSAG
jgi:hypothetical protein